MKILSKKTLNTLDKYAKMVYNYGRKLDNCLYLSPLPIRPCISGCLIHSSYPF
jgi:hypothetical protein